MSSLYAHLRVQTTYSFLRSTIRPQQLAEQLIHLGQPCVAVQDQNNLFGAFRLSQVLAQASVKPIIGCNLGVSLKDAAKRETHKGAVGLLCANETGYRNLCTLVSQAWLDDRDEAAVDLALVARHAEGLIFLSGAYRDGLLPRALRAESRTEAIRDSRAKAGPGQTSGETAWTSWAKPMLDVVQSAFPGRAYVEVQRGQRVSDTSLETQLFEIAHRYGWPCLATREVCCLALEDWTTYQMLLSLEAKKTMDELDIQETAEDHVLCSGGVMEELYQDVPALLENVSELTSRCNFFLRPVSKPRLPRFETPDGTQSADFLKETARAKLEARLTRLEDGKNRRHAPEAYHARLEHELTIIAHHQFEGYFLIVADIVEWAKEQDIPVGPGRGSGAGSLVAFALGITNLDPLYFGLFFERFLNPERDSLPDFDIDFCQLRRHEVIEYAQRKYGASHVANIITFGEFQARNSLQDTARSLGKGHMLGLKLSKMAHGLEGLSRLKLGPHARPGEVPETSEPSHLQLCRLYREDGDVRSILDLAMRLEGLYRQSSTHAAGIVLSDQPLVHYLPLYRDPRAVIPVTQFDIYDLAHLGLVKFDFLGLTTLTVIHACLASLAARGIRIDLETLDLSDPPTLELFQKADSFGVFQLESEGIKRVLRRMKPDRFEDIIATVALYRPGPMDNIASYCDRKHGREPIHYRHPLLEPILAETYGLPVYQEQVMQMAQLLGNYTPGRADVLRSAMGKKNEAVMQAERSHFVSGAHDNGIDAPTANAIFDDMAKFGGYGFNKSHAACYALLAFQTAWLKTHYPAAYFAAAMSHETLANSVRSIRMADELKRREIRLLPPSVQHSEAFFSLEDAHTIRFGLGAIRGLASPVVSHMCAYREAGETSLQAFLSRFGAQSVTLDKKSLEGLIFAGALDEVFPNRHRLLRGIDILLALAARGGQQTLFDAQEPDIPISLPAVSELSLEEKLDKEYQMTGFYLTGHPLDAHARAMAARRVISSAGLPDSETEGWLAGIPLKVGPPRLGPRSAGPRHAPGGPGGSGGSNASGGDHSSEILYHVLFSDQRGSYDVEFPEDLYKLYAKHLERRVGQPYLHPLALHCVFRRRSEDRETIRIRQLHYLAETQKSPWWQIELRGLDGLASIRDLLEQTQRVEPHAPDEAKTKRGGGDTGSPGDSGATGGGPPDASGHASVPHRLFIKYVGMRQNLVWQVPLKQAVDFALARQLETCEGVVLSQARRPAGPASGSSARAGKESA